VVAAIAIGVAVPLATNNDDNNNSSSTGGNAPSPSSPDAPTGEEPTAATTTPWLKLGETIEGTTWKDRFGYSVATSGDGKVVAVGAISIDEGASFRQVSVYEVVSNETSSSAASWEQLGQSLQGIDVVDDFGWDVKLSEDGRILTIGTGPGGNYVRVYALSIDRTTWIELGSDIVDAEAADGECFGCAIDALVMKDGVTIVVAVGAKDGVNNTGSVQVYFLAGPTEAWEQVGSTVVGIASTTNDDFGEDVALSSDGGTLRLAVGAPGGDYAHIYALQTESTGDDWTLLGNMNGEAIGDKFGSNVALSKDGKIVAVSARRNSATPQQYGSGQIQVYKEQSDATWTQLGDEINGDNDGQFGFSLAMSADGTRVAGGANLDNGDGKGFATGNVRVFDFDEGTNAWIQVGDELVGQDRADEFGQSVALSGDGVVLVVGTKFGVGGEEQERTGHVKVFYQADQ
jgi:hypothetical protein